MIYTKIIHYVQYIIQLYTVNHAAIITRIMANSWNFATENNKKAQNILLLLHDIRGIETASRCPRSISLSRALAWNTRHL